MSAGQLQLEQLTLVELPAAPEAVRCLNCGRPMQSLCDLRQSACDGTSTHYVVFGDYMKLYRLTPEAERINFD